MLVQVVVVWVAGTTHCAIVATVVVGVSVPKPISTMPVKRTPSTRLTDGPPSMMTMRFHTASR